MTSARHRGAGLALVIALASVCISGLALRASPAQADTTQTTIFVDDQLVLTDPVGGLTRLRALGITTLRVDIPWAAIAPDTNSLRRPDFSAADPGAYGKIVWGPYDAVIVEAHRLGMAIDLDLAPGAPRWATGAGQPTGTKGYPFAQWEPDATQFGLFAQATGERYSGNWDPYSRRLDPGNPADLPRVSFWSIWNEPDYGPSLAPQGLPGHPGVEDSPRLYRGLVDSAWSALARTGHRTPTDTIIIGELAPRSELTAPGAFTDFNGMTPIVFLQNLYCLTAAYRPLRGAAATLRGCPSTAAGSRRFASENPGLFANSGVSDHPYDEWFAPDQELDIPKLTGWALENTQDTSLATIGVLERGLDRLTAAYGNHEKLAIWDTEYGYLTSPPHRLWAGDERPWPKPTLAAYYDNWAEYLHWKDPRIRSFAQYLLRDGVAATRADDYGSFSSGLINFNGTRKADYGSFQMPLYLPRMTAPSVRSGLEVWGAARPAAPALMDLGTGGQTRTVTLLFRPIGATTWSILTTVTVNAEGYFDTHLTFPASGTLMAEWKVPADNLLTLPGTSLTSRHVQVTVR